MRNRVVVVANALASSPTLAVTNGMDYWRGLYDLFWCCACGCRLVREHVGLCNRGGCLGLGWYVPALVNAAIQGKHCTVSLGGWIVTPRAAAWPIASTRPRRRSGRLGERPLSLEKADEICST
jgi:hypothetical protein